MSASRRELNRLVALGSAAAVIGVPIVLVASTWQPLEPAPRGDQDTDDPDDALSEEPRNRNKRGRQDRHGGAGDGVPATIPSD